MFNRMVGNVSNICIYNMHIQYMYIYIYIYIYILEINNKYISAETFQNFSSGCLQ